MHNLYQRSALTLAVFLLFCNFLLAQKPYFQQEVNYKIAATLDDRKHTLTGNIEFEYINNSPDALPELWIHVWPNAFKTRSTAFCRQKLRQQNTTFYFAPDSSLGYIKQLDFTVNGQKATWNYDLENPDIARITLPQALQPGGRITVATPFFEKIPASFSRLGHVETSYQMTQWYPKPAVYDREGWHPIPYLDQGEFYSEFGAFDVTITLPANYIVGATGALQTASEITFLNQKERETRAEMTRRANSATVKTTKVKKKKGNGLSRDAGPTDSFPPSAAETKTLRWIASNVHDFAWFADKRFWVMKDTAHLASGRTVDCWAMFTDEGAKYWQRGAFYVKRSVEFYSQHVGEYAWPHATAVHSALSAGGGMEYPMITVIGNTDNASSLDDVITHEVGHNWFYGMLASNERDHPWMDEGMNSYYEHRYMREYYHTEPLEAEIPKKIYSTKRWGSLLNNTLLLLARNGEDIPGDANSDDMTSIGYGIQAYMKTSMAMRWLEKSSGTERFDAAMKAYFTAWNMKHPRPEDFYTTMKSNGLQAEWLMQEMQTRKYSDPALTSVKKQADGSYDIKIKQRGTIDAPVPVTAIKNGQPGQTAWLMPGNSILHFPAVEADQFVIDPDQLTLDLFRSNNQRRTNGLLAGRRPTQVRLFAPFEHPKKATIGVLPWIGRNNYDRIMAGLVLYNPPFPGQRLQYYLAPGFALGTKKLVGGGDIRWRMHPAGNAVKRITVGINGRSFHDDYRGRDVQYYTRFYRVTPNIRVDLRSKNLAIQQSIEGRFHFIGQEIGRQDTIFPDIPGGPLTFVANKSYVRNNIWDLTYRLNNTARPNPFSLATTLEGQNWDDAGISKSYLRLSTTWTQQLYYANKKKVGIRFYAGTFRQNSSSDRKSVGFGATDAFARGSLSLAQNGYTDYKYDYIFLNRNGDSGLLSRQTQMAEGGFKYAFSSAYAASGDVGHSNKLLLALNLTADLPKKLPLGLPIKPYFDLGWANQSYLPGSNEDRSIGDQLFWSGGFSLELLKGAANVYFPVYSSKQLQRLYRESGNYLQRITWSFRLDGWEPRETMLREFR